MRLHEETIEITVRDGGAEEAGSASAAMGAFVAHPEKPAQGQGNGKVRAIIVIQEAFGVNHDVQEVCRSAAREGYLAVAPEVFHRFVGRGVVFGYHEFAKIGPIFQKLSNHDLKNDLEGTLRFLKERHQISVENVAVMGFCLGGLTSMLAATAFPIATAIAYYGGGMVGKREGVALSPIIQDFKNIRCPVLLFFGGKDQHITPDQVSAVEKELKAQKITSEVVVFPDADHAFANADRSQYHEASAKAAWKQTTAWLKNI